MNDFNFRKHLVGKLGEHGLFIAREDLEALVELGEKVPSRGRAKALAGGFVRLLRLKQEYSPGVAAADGFGGLCAVTLLTAEPGNWRPWSRLTEGSSPSSLRVEVSNEATRSV